MIYKAPSKKKLVECLNITPEKAELVRRIIRGEVSTFDADKFPNSNTHFKACYHTPKKVERLLYCLNEVLEGFGIECIGEVKTYGPPAEYINVGETYACTVIFNRITDTFQLSSWGDWLERNENKPAFKNW